MGILVDAVAIALGAIIGGFIKKEISIKKFAIFGVSVGIIALVSFIESVFEIRDTALKSEHLYVLVFALVVGYFIGEISKLDKKTIKNPTEQRRKNAFVQASIFFIVGGLQISGPILLGANGDSSLLYLKSGIDFPFAIMFGAIYGKSSAISALPTALIQLVIALIAHVAGDVISEQMLSQLCSVGYVILFFSGMNMLSDKEQGISTVKMLPSIPIIIIVNLILSLVNV